MPPLVFMAIAWLLPRFIQCQTQDQVEALYNNLLNGQNKNMRPAVNHAYPTDVNVSFELFQILDVDEVMGKLTISGLLKMEWYNHRMRWNPIDYGGVFTINVPSFATWKPDLVLTEPIDNAFAFGYMQNWVNVRYLYDGMAIFAPSEVLSSACDITVTYYPFDTQICEINLYPWGINKHEIVLNTYTTEVSKSIFSENAEWMLDKTETLTGVMFDTFYFYRVVLYLKRRPTFVIVNVVLPIFFMSVLNVLVFFLPASSGERVSFAITVLLAIAFFMTIVNDTLPKSSNPIPTICYLLLGSLVLSTFIVMMTIFNLRIYHRPAEQPLSKMYLAIAFSARRCRRRSFRCQSKRIKADAVTEIDLSKENAITNRRASDEDAIKWSSAHNNKRRADDATASAYEDYADLEDVNWKTVSEALDSIGIVISTVWVVSLTIAIIVMVTAYS
ncbi:hypothetical protein DPMN_086620 [Dreissena polymorpha]|uniref:Uncharacterized protein n=1 Tax=Dreissena polymorpha TaxID=45954 RepID=A0A9D4KS72_DREPO|nr:hypothetical protein DPMN_086620 [Dreissena polymorpha]